MKTPGEVLGPTYLSPVDIIRAIHARVVELDTTHRIDKFIKTGSTDRYTITKQDFPTTLVIGSRPTPVASPGPVLGLNIELHARESGRTATKPDAIRSIASAIDSIADYIYERTDHSPIGIFDIIVVSSAITIEFCENDVDANASTVVIKMLIGFGRSDNFRPIEDGHDLAASET